MEWVVTLVVMPKKINTSKIRRLELYGSPRPSPAQQHCQHAVSVEQLAHFKSHMTPSALEYLDGVAPDENQFMCAAQAQGHAMHGVYTNNVAESFNKSAKALRARPTIFALVQGLVELRQALQIVHGDIKEPNLMIGRFFLFMGGLPLTNQRVGAQYQN